MTENEKNGADSETSLDADYSGVDPETIEKARVLFETVSPVLGTMGTLSNSSGFFELGGNSLNSICTITKLQEKGYHIDISDFLEANNLGEVISKMSTNPDCHGDQNLCKFSVESMKEEHKKHVIDMVVCSFYEKAELEQLLRHEIEKRDVEYCVTASWDALVRDGLSIVLRDGTVLHCSLMATAERLTAAENVATMHKLEDCVIEVARDRGFHGVFATNTSPLTQQLARDVFGFQALVDYQVNQYVDSHGDRVFGHAPDDMRVTVCWKAVK